MNEVTVSELRRSAGAIWRRVEAGETFTITRNGKPIALLARVDQRAEVPTPQAHLTARFEAVISRIQERARATGADRLSEEDIQAEIDAVRRERAGRSNARHRARRGEH